MKRKLDIEKIDRQIKQEIKQMDKEDNKGKHKVKKPIMIMGFTLLAIIIMAGSIVFYVNKNHKFKALSVEVGTESISIKDFLKKDTLESESEFITDISKINLNEVASYEIALLYDGVREVVTLNVVDTIEPTLEVKNVTIYDDEKINGKEDFITLVEDASGSVTTSLETNIDYSIIGDQEVIIKAVDKNGNITIKKAVLTIIKDTEGPVFDGLSNIVIKKNGKINYTDGVSATDLKDGVVEFSYDASVVDVTKSGAYYVPYTARDKSGNETIAKRKVTVDHDEDDTKALVQKIADSLSSDPEELRDYCRNNIKYKTVSGGNTPDESLYYGLTKHEGNCYVHAMCFQALLNAKGIENQLIWVTNKTHYWNLVKIDGVWRHMDSTPDRNHRKISIMTDAQRLSTLSGRKWDTTLWPAAE